MGGMLFIVASSLVCLIGTLIYLLKRKAPGLFIFLVCGLCERIGWKRPLHYFGKSLRQEAVLVTSPNGSSCLMPADFQPINDILKLKIREDDVFIVTYPKSGSTWMQEIVWLVCNDADVSTANKQVQQFRVPFLELAEEKANSPGFSSLVAWPTNAQRLIKTHLPFEFMPADVQSGKGKIIYVARNPKDVCVSFYHFHRAFLLLPHQTGWNDFLSKFRSGQTTYGDWFSHNLTYWKMHLQDKERFHFVTYEALKKNFRGELVSICKFLDKHLGKEQLDAITEHCAFEGMSKNDATNWKLMSDTGMLDVSTSKFMRKGEVGDWKNHFTVNQSASFDALYHEKMMHSSLRLEFEA